MRLVLCQSDPEVDWYTIEKAEHDGRMSLEPVVVGGYPTLALYYAGRISDADVEGTAKEMLGLAAAIAQGELEQQFGRCAVKMLPNGDVAFWSPRNSQVDGVVTRAEAEALAAEIRRRLS
jgi:hypothetical protein